MTVNNEQFLTEERLTPEELSEMYGEQLPDRNVMSPIIMPLPFQPVDPVPGFTTAPAPGPATVTADSLPKLG